jgi:hypothetical protein
MITILSPSPPSLAHKANNTQFHRGRSAPAASPSPSPAKNFKLTSLERHISNTAVPGDQDPCRSPLKGYTTKVLTNEDRIHYMHSTAMDEQSSSSSSSSYDSSASRKIYGNDISAWESLYGPSLSPPQGPSSEVTTIQNRIDRSSDDVKTLITSSALPSIFTKRQVRTERTFSNESSRSDLSSVDYSHATEVHPESSTTEEKAVSKILKDSQGFRKFRAASKQTDDHLKVRYSVATPRIKAEETLAVSPPTPFDKTTNKTLSTPSAEVKSPVPPKKYVVNSKPRPLDLLVTRGNILSSLLEGVTNGRRALRSLNSTSKSAIFPAKLVC